MTAERLISILRMVPPDTQIRWRGIWRIDRANVVTDWRHPEKKQVSIHSRYG